MIERRLILRGFVSARAALACALVASVGCTMCPDPFDYSGPVPNGTPPQNDFRARSGGILPLGGAPKPWPTVVESEGDKAPPADGESRSILVADRRFGGDSATGPVADADVNPTPDVLGEIPEVPSEEPTLEVPDPEAGAAVEIAPAPEDLGAWPDSEAVSVVPPPASEGQAAAEPLFQARETPGWRPRR